MSFLATVYTATIQWSPRAYNKADRAPSDATGAKCHAG